MPHTHFGGCHCRRVRFAVTADLVGVTECNCSICRSKGYLHLIVPAEQFQLLSGAEDLVTYRFNTGVAQHRFCRHCGIHSFYVPRSDPDKIDVNVRCLDGVDPARLDIHRFDGQDWESSMQGKVPWRQEPASRLLVLAVLTVQRAAMADFEAYERLAMAILRRHGGKLERVVRVPAADGVATFEEVHLLSFPDSAIFAGFRSDPELRAAAALRDASIVKTTIIEGREGPAYTEKP